MTIEASVETTTQFSTREVPWMKLGKLVEHAPTSAEAAAMAGIDFKVEPRSITYRFENTTKTIARKKALIRVDTGEELGLVSSGSYKIVQYSEAFDFMDTIDSRYVAAGALKGGRQAFMVVKAPIDLNVLDGDDPNELFAVLRTSHDTTRSLEISMMSLRGRCMNQLPLQSFAKNAPYRWSIPHVGNVAAKLAEAKSSIEKMTNYAARFESLVAQLADIKVDEELSRTIIKKVIPSHIKKSDEVVTAIETLRTTAPTVGYVGTGWGLVNAVSEYYDWSRTGGTAESRFLGALEGQTIKTVNKTVAHLLRLQQV